MYSIHDYGDMVADRGRTDAYAAALRSRITPESVVLDIGCGPGILTLLACQAGARRVYAVEPDGLIRLAQQAVSANGFSGRVEFRQALSTAIDLPEKVDVIVSDVHGVLPFFSGALKSIIDARDRFLRPGGVLIPACETLWVAVVAAPGAHARIAGPWEQPSGLDCDFARLAAVNSWRQFLAAAESLLVQPSKWADLDYSALAATSASGEAVWTVEEAGDAHGLCVWFDSEMAPGIGFSNAPGAAGAHVFQQAFFPWPRACPLEPGDAVAVQIRADMVGEDYVHGWNTTIHGAGGDLKAQFRQSQFHSLPYSADWQRKSGGSFMPVPNHEAVIDKMILELLFSGINLEAISRRVAGQYPQRFPHWRNALTRVGEMSMKYCQ